ncbi:MAG TPA: response regulator transcription factor [Coriobacteriia bacterium]|nr:response regulator transcription factor [Coriobacteriia bacterium]
MNASRILVVENDAQFAVSMRALLASAGYEVHNISNANDPLLDAEIIAADLIMLDLALPGRDGFSVLKQIRDNAFTANKPVVMVSADGPMHYRLRGLSLGADDFVVKPPNHQELLLRIAGLLRRSRPDRAPDVCRVMVEYGGSRSFVNADSIRYVEAARNYCYLHTDQGRKLSSANIGSLERMLGGMFIRTHRSYLVNTHHVMGGRWLSRSAYVLDIEGVGAGEPTVPVSRAYRELVRNALSGMETRAMSTTA